MGWEVIYKRKKLPELKRAVLLEGMPGIGNVGKVAVDFIIDELKAKKIADFFSHTLPHSVFVNDRNLVELPTIELYAVQRGPRKPDILLLTGDVQPIDEQSTYAFTEKLLEVCRELGCAEIVAIGGIGLPTEPKVPQVYCTGNERAIINRYRAGTKINHKLYGIVGPIVGVSGLVLGLSKKYGIPAIGLLAETYGHPMYLGIVGAREILKVLNRKLSLKLDIDQLDEEIKQIEKEMIKRTEELSNVSKQAAFNRLKSNVNYIG